MKVAAAAATDVLLLAVGTCGWPSVAADTTFAVVVGDPAEAAAAADDAGAGAGAGAGAADDAGAGAGAADDAGA